MARDLERKLPAAGVAGSGGGVALSAKPRSGPAAGGAGGARFKRDDGSDIDSDDSDYESETTRDILDSKATDLESQFEGLIERLRRNDHSLKVLDLRKYSLSKDQLIQIDAAIRGNSNVLDVKWGIVPSDEESLGLKVSIEQWIISGLWGPENHPSDYELAQLSQHVNNYNKGAAETMVGADGTWGRRCGDYEILREFRGGEGDHYFGVLYLDEVHKRLVLAHKGIDFEVLDLFAKESDLRDFIRSVFYANVEQFMASAYLATKDAVEKARRRGCTLTITGYSLGGFLAELSIYYCCFDREINFPEAKGVVFESPGSKAILDSFKSNIDSLKTRRDLDEMRLTTYLSIPNPLNICNQRVGKVYVVFPDIEERKPDLIEKVAEWVGAEKKVKAIRSIMYSSMELMLGEFNPETGKPRVYREALDWPYLERSPSYGERGGVIGAASRSAGAAAGEAAAGIPGLGAVASGTVGFLTKQVLGILVGDRTITTVLDVIVEFASGRLEASQFYDLQKYLDSKYRRAIFGFGRTDEYYRSYKCHYELKEVNEREDVFDPRRETDRYLDMLVRNKEAVLKYVERQRVKKENLRRFAEAASIEAGRSEFSDYKIVLRDDDKDSPVQIHTIERLREIFWKYLSQSDIRNDIEEGLRLGGRNRGEISSDIFENIGDNYFERREEIAGVWSAISEHRVVLVRGEQGAGKTTIAQECGKRSKEAGKIVKWCSRGEGSALYRKMANELGVVIEGMKIEDIVRLVHLRLRELREEIIIIYDNIESYEEIKPFLRLPENLRIIVTTRRAEIEGLEAEMVVIGRYREEEAIRYVEDRIEGIDKDRAREIVRRVGQLPFDLKIAVIAIRSGEELSLDEMAGNVSDVVIERLANDETEEGKIAWKMLQYLTRLDPDFVPLRFLRYIGALDSRELLVGLGKLKERGLITETEVLIEERRVRGTKVHRLLQAGVKRKVESYEATRPQKVESLEIVREVLVRGLLENFPEVESITDPNVVRGNLYLSSIENITESNEEYPRSILELELFTRYIKQMFHTDFSKLKYKIGKLEEVLARVEGPEFMDTKIKQDYQRLMAEIYNENGKYKKAEDLCKKLLDGVEIAEGVKVETRLLKIISIYADVLSREAKYEEAQGLCDKVLGTPIEIYEKEAKIEIAKIRNIRGNVYMCQGMHDEALTQYQEALVMKMVVHGEGAHPSVATTMYAIGNVYMSQGRHGEALRRYQEVLAMERFVYGDEAHPAVAITIHEIGNVYMRQGMYDEALRLFQDALEMKRAVYGEDAHPEMAATMHEIGSVYIKQGKYEEALRQYQEVLVMERSIYGEGAHPSEAATMHFIGNVYKSQGRYGEALTQYQDALAMKRLVYGEGAHPSVALTIHEIGNIFIMQTRYWEAQRQLENVLIMEKVIYGVEAHPEVSATMHAIGSVCMGQGRYDEALSHFQKVLEMDRIIYEGKVHPEVAATMYTIGSVYMSQGRYDEALSHFQEVLSIDRAVNGEGAHPDVAATMRAIGGVYMRQGRHEEALSQYQEVLVMDSAIYGERAHPDSAVTLYEMGKICFRLNKFKEAAEFFKEQLVINKKFHQIDEVTRVLDELNNIGQYYYINEESSITARYYEDLSRFCEELLKDIPLVGVSKIIHCKGHALFSTGDRKGALESYKQALRTAEAAAGPERRSEHIEYVATLYRNIGVLALQVDENRLLAETCLTTCLRMSIELHGEEHESVIEVKEIIRAMQRAKSACRLM